jgi:hypothetical protein
MKRIASLLAALAMLSSLLLINLLQKEKVATKSVSQPQPFNQIIIHNERSLLPVWHPNYQTAQSVIFEEEGEPEEKELEGVQCPIPMKDRVKNYTGIQCVFSSLECIGRWAEIQALIEPPITSRSDCKRYSGPKDASEKLTRLKVKFINSYGDKKKGIEIIKQAMADGRGTLWGVPGHAMVLCHYDESAKVVKYINNSNHKLPVQTMTLDEFNRKWDSWVMVVYNEPDPFPAKARGIDLPNLIPIIDRNSPQGQYPKSYIPKPIK